MPREVVKVETRVDTQAKADLARSQQDLLSIEERVSNLEEVDLEGVVNNLLARIEDNTKSSSKVDQ